MAERVDVMRKVRALLDKADSTNFPEERDALIAKADALMAAHAIEEFELQFARPVNEREKPSVRTFEFDQSAPWEVRQQLVQIFGALARHCGVLLGQYSYTRAKAVGFKSDLDWLDWLYTSVRLHMMSTMAPKPNEKLTFEENIVMLKETGLKWAAIYDKLLPVFFWHKKLVAKSVPVRPESQWGYERGWVEMPNGFWYPKEMPRPIGVWFTGVYTNHCKEHNLPRNYASPEVYRRSFIDGYVTRLRARLMELGRNRQEAAMGKGLVLANRDADLKEALYLEFPDLRPHPDYCDCEGCHTVKCRDMNCKRPACVQRRKPVKFSRARYVEPKMDAGAMANGSRAADNADLMGGRNNLGGKREELS